MKPGILGCMLLVISVVGCGGGSGGAGTTTGDVPAAPSGLVASARAGAVSLSWASVSGATSYNLYWSLTPGVTKTSGTEIAGVTSAYQHTGLTNGSTYYYVVTATNDSGESVEAAEATATPTYTITGRVMIGGPVQGATVTAYAINADGSRGTPLATGVTSEPLGGFSITLTLSPTAPILLEAAGGSYDEIVSGVAVTLTASNVLSAVVPVDVTRVAITPLTTMAAARAQALAAGGESVAAAVAAANARVGQHFAIPDIVGIVPPAANNQLEVKTASVDERAYALVLAGLAFDSNARTIDLVEALVDDVSDGLFDGKKSGVALTYLTSGSLQVSLSPNTATTNVQNAINTFAASTLNSTGLTEHTISATALNVGTSGLAGFYVTTTALPAWMSGQSGSVQVGASGGTSPYVCTLTAGAPPSWMIFTPSTCTLSGTAPILGGGTTRSVLPAFTLTISDSAGVTASQVLVLVPSIVQAAPVLALVNPAPAATVGQAYSVNLVASISGGSAPYSYRSDTFANGAPPLGMIIDLDGNLTGTPGKAGTYVFGVCAVDLVGGSSCGTTSITVNPSPAGGASVTTYSGTFNGSGTFTRDFGETVCTFYNTLSGVITVTSTTGGTNPGMTSHVQGNWTSTATGGSTATFTCLDTSVAWEDSPTVTVSGSAISFTIMFVTPGGSNVSNAFSGTQGATTIKGSLVTTFDTSSGSATMPATLTQQ